MPGASLPGSRTLRGSLALDGLQWLPTTCTIPQARSLETMWGQTPKRTPAACKVTAFVQVAGWSMWNPNGRARLRPGLGPEACEGVAGSIVFQQRQNDHRNVSQPGPPLAVTLRTTCSVHARLPGSRGQQSTPYRPQSACDTHRVRSRGPSELAWAGLGTVAAAVNETSRRSSGP